MRLRLFGPARCVRLGLGLVLSAAAFHLVFHPTTAFAQPRDAAEAAVAQQRVLLNSERIEQRFGSYGIDVLESGSEYRVSNLYSLDGSRRICRTFAVVRYPERVDPAFAAAHRAILAGGSIGAVLTAAGWHVEKRNLAFDSLSAGERVAKLMGIPAHTLLATHVYVLDIVKGTQRFQYAAIVEIHHPGYLSVEDLASIYGAPDPAGRQALVTKMLGVAETKMTEQP